MMAQRIVDDLEIVQIDEHDRQFLLQATRLVESARQFRFHEMPVR